MNREVRVLFIAKKLGAMMRKGIMYLSGILKANDFKVYFIDSSNYDEIDSFVKKISPDLLAYSCTSGEFNHYNKINHQLKKHGILSVIGGPHATFFGHTFMKEEKTSFDGACAGEGEYALLDLCNCIRDGSDYTHIKNWAFRLEDGSVVVNELRPLIEDLDKLPFPDIELDKNLIEKTALIWLHRGCPFKCTYCMNHKWRKLYKGLGKVIRVASPEYCIKLTKRSISENTENICFQDDTFGHDINWLRSFCDLYKKEIGLPWGTHLYPTMITEERVSIMVDAGCTFIQTAIETGNEKRRRELLKRPISNKFIEEVATLLHSYGIAMKIQNILLLPGETFETAMETFELNARCKPEIATASKFQPYPGLELTEKAVEFGHLKENDVGKNLPENFHWISTLKFADEREVDKINNILNLFTFGTYFTFMKPIILLLVKIPNNILHHHIDNIAWKIITHRNDDEIIPSRRIKFKVFMKFLINFVQFRNIKETIDKDKKIRHLNFTLE